METIESKLKGVSGYLMSVYRNSKDGWYEIEIGLPIKWVIKETSEINCEVIQETDKGKILKISPKPNSGVIVDDLIDFLSYVVETNKRVSDKEDQLKEIIATEKKAIEDKLKTYLDELENIKVSSFDDYKKPEKVTEEPVEKKVKKRLKSESEKEDENGEE